MDERIREALQTPPDFSEAFDNFVDKICERLSSVFGVLLYHDNDMNYSAAHQIKLHLNREYVPINFKSADVIYELVTLISSKGPFFTFICLHREYVTDFESLALPAPGEYWLRLEPDKISPKIQAQMSLIIAEMELMNYTLLSGTLLDQVIEGFVTDMDGIPATLFQVLFSELY
jgi:hypothetical protein